MQKTKIFTLILILLGINVSAQKVTISGKAPDYAGDEFIFQYYSDRITNTEKELGKAVVDEKGNFNAKLEIEQTMPVFFDLGAIRGILYVSKGEKYELVLPPKIEKTEADLINPFFRPDEIYIGIKNKNKDELNYIISDFNLRYNLYLDKNYIKILQLGYKADIHSQINKLDSIYAHINNAYFTNYKEYKYAALKQLAYMRNNETVQKNFFGDKPVLYHNTAYMNLFNNVFDNFLAIYSKTPKGKEIPVDIVDKRSLWTVKKTLSDWGNLKNDQIIEMVVLKGLYDGFHNKTYPKEAVFEVLDSVVMHSQFAENKIIAKNIKNSAKALLVGYEAPTFLLPDITGKLIGNEDLKGKFIYLNFCNLNSATALQELELLQVFSEKYPEYFDVVTISTDDNFDDVVDHFSKNNYNWKLLHYDNNKKLLKDYKIHVYPTYFLINPDGILRLAPSPGPADNFEEQFGEVWRGYKRELEREKYNND